MTGYGGGSGKIRKQIEFPANLSLPLSDKRSCEYSLTGVIIHVGVSASSGHYTAYIKKPSTERGGRWYHMDDECVSPVSLDTVLRQTDAYVLFYCRKEIQVEFPTPPSRSSMSAAEATKVGKERARARSDSLGRSSSMRERSAEAAPNDGIARSSEHKLGRPIENDCGFFRNKRRSPSPQANRCHTTTNREAAKSAQKASSLPRVDQTEGVSLLPTTIPTKFVPQSSNKIQSTLSMDTAAKGSAVPDESNGLVVTKAHSASSSSTSVPSPNDESPLTNVRNACFSFS
ncbi:MAG: hypothetical protein ACRDL7_13680 [Gaiellaceae bacterium]